TFTTSGNWICPTGITSINISLYGAGGGGGGASTGNRVGAGGGGGGFTSLSGISVTPGNSYAITVGAGGAGGSNAGTAGANGGTSNAFGLAASGGSGGGGMSTGTLPTGGVGGAGNGGSVFRNGGNGAAPTAGTGSAGGGGGCAGITSTGSNGGVPTGGVGGGGLAGNGGNGSTVTATPGIAGTTYGGGGGGGKGGAAGGPGASGVVVITYTLPPPTISGLNTICNGSSATLTASGNAGTVSWFTVATGGTSIGTGTSITVSPTSTTTYYCEQTYLGVTSTRSSFTVNVSTITLSITQINNLCFGGNSGSINLTASGGTQFAQTATIDQQQAGAGCGTTSGNFWQSFTPAISGKFSSIDININTNITNAGTWYVYSGAGQSGTILASGSYNFPTQGGALWKNIVITGNPVLIAGQQYTFRMTSVDWSQACGGNVYPGGTSQSGISDLSFKTYMIPNPYNYSWSNSAVTEDISSLAAGGYTVTVTDANSCSAATTATITQPAQITLNNSVSNTICSGTPLNIPISASGGTSPYTFSWIAQNNANTSGESITSVSSSTITDNITSTSSTTQNVTYSITITDINACVLTNTIGVNVDPATTISSQSTVSQTICQGNNFNAITVTATGLSLTYQWYSNSTASTIGGTVISGANSSSYTPPSGTAGTKYYYCVVGGICGTVTSSVSGAITVATSPVITGSNNICQGSTTTLTASGTGNTWSSSITSVATINSTSGFVIGNSPGNTTIACTSSFGCVSTFNLTVNQAPVLTSPTTLSICSGGTLNQTLTANPSAGTTFSWYSIGNSNVSGESTTSQSGSILNNTLVNTSTTAQNVLYTVNPISSLGCAGNQTVTVTVNLNPNFITSPISSTICVGDSALVNAKEEKLDAAQTAANQISWWLAGNNGWQSFTPSYSGKLLKIRLRTVTYSSGTTITARIYSGVPATGTLLGSASVTKGANIDSWDDYVFSGSGISVTGGSNYY
ncbi:MAG: PKD-like domain-containing protein, partial [Bacteroidota bacterium]